MDWPGLTGRGDYPHGLVRRGRTGARARGEGGCTPATQSAASLISWNVHGDGEYAAKLLDDLRSGQLTGGEPVRDFVLLLRSRADKPQAGSRAQGGEARLATVPSGTSPTGAVSSVSPCFMPPRCGTTNRP
jgi:hypothetical protein